MEEQSYSNMSPLRLWISREMRKGSELWERAKEGSFSPFTSCSGLSLLSSPFPLAMVKAGHLFFISRSSSLFRGDSCAVAAKRSYLFYYLYYLYSAFSPAEDPKQLTAKRKEKKKRKRETIHIQFLKQHNNKLHHGVVLDLRAGSSEGLSSEPCSHPSFKRY